MDTSQSNRGTRGHHIPYPRLRSYTLGAPHYAKVKWRFYGLPCCRKPMKKKAYLLSLLMILLPFAGCSGGDGITDTDGDGVGGDDAPCPDGEYLLDEACVESSDSENDAPVIDDKSCSPSEVEEDSRCRPMLPPSALDYGIQSIQATIGDNVHLIPSFSGDGPNQWAVSPFLPSGLVLDNVTGEVNGIPDMPMLEAFYTISASNEVGSTEVIISITIRDLAPGEISALSYGEASFEFVWNVDTVNLTPTLTGGVPIEWGLYPNLPNGLLFENGSIQGFANTVFEWTLFTVWANNSGGSDSVTIYLRVVDMTPLGISWGDGQDVAIEANKSALISVVNDGPYITSWEVYPQLPDGLSLQTNGDIRGIPTERTEWRTYRLWANNTGGSFSTNLSLAVHDIDADWNDITSGVGSEILDYGSAAMSLILPLGEWSFPIAFDAAYRPTVSASHSGKGRVIGYGHENMVADQNGGAENTLSLNAILWVCGGNNKTIGVQVDYDHFEDELADEGFTVISDAWPSDLTSMDCFIGDFWNSYSVSENTVLEAFISSGGGVVLGGHSWYWAYSNSDVAGQYPGNLILNTTGLFVSPETRQGGTRLTNNPPSLYHRFHASLTEFEAHYSHDLTINNSTDLSIAIYALERIMGQIPMDYEIAWGPILGMLENLGWVEITSTNTFDVNEDPLDTYIMKLARDLLSSLPAHELPAHPSSSAFPGDVSPNASRVERTLTIDGNFAGLPSEFTAAGARHDGRMSTGLYAVAGEVVNITFPSEIVGTGVNVLVGAHTDNVLRREVLERHPIVYRAFEVESTELEVGNAFGGPIYIRVPAGSSLGEFDVTIENAVLAPYWKQGVTDLSHWKSTIRHYPAPWAEIESDQFILTVPSSVIRDLEDPNATMDFWDQALVMQHELSGFTPWPRVERVAFDVQISNGWMHSGYPFMAHLTKADEVVDSTRLWSQGDWGFFHELGHNHQWWASLRPPGATEGSVNLFSVKLMVDLVGLDLQYAHNYGQLLPSARVRHVEEYFQGGSNISSWEFWTALETYLLVWEAFGWEPITEALTVYYSMEDPPTTDDEIMDRWVIELSAATGYNLAPYHEAWGFPLTQETKAALLHLPVWVDDPLRGWVHEYDMALRNITATNIASSSVQIEWDVYDNGTNTELTLCYGQTDGGATRSEWAFCTDVGTPTIGHESQSLTGLTSSTTYYFRIVGNNANGDTWSSLETFVTT